MTRYRVFYEDEAGGEIKEFGPHLLCACVSDRIESQTLWDIKASIDGQPKKGDSKLLAACKQHAARDLDVVVFALFDADKLNELLRIPKGSVEDLRAALTTEIDSPKVRPFVLDRNLETLVKAAAGCLEPPYEAPIPKRHNERDKILGRSAHTSRSVRDCILRHVPTFAVLVDAVVREIHPSPA